jgi:hypothetical protein
MGIFQATTHADVDTVEKLVVGNQRFKVVTQLKAAMFNSMINILLVAAPLGSMASYPLIRQVR